MSALHLTAWRMTQSIANPSPKAEFPAIREIYREFSIFEVIQALDQLKAREITALFERIPYSSEQGILIW